VIGLVVGRALVGKRPYVGELIERAVPLLDAQTTEQLGDAEANGLPIRIDEVTERLLGERFRVERDRLGPILLGERWDAERTRGLLGVPTPCVGREQELSVLAGLATAAFAEPTALVALVTGPPGVGKSRLLHEFVRRLRESGRPPEIWIGRGDPTSAGS